MLVILRLSYVSMLERRVRVLEGKLPHGDLIIIGNETLSEGVSPVSHFTWTP
jgi:hypothetical protein